MKLGIFKAFDNYHIFYIKACEDLGIEYEVVDIISTNWLENILNSNCDGFLCRPPSKFQERKSMFDEKLYIVDNILQKPIYPSYDELLIYENKRMISYWLELNKFPHPKTDVFYQKKEYLDFVENKARFPLVVKSNIGSASKGVSIIHSKHQAKSLANKYFGLINPKLVKGHTSIKTGKLIRLTSYGSREKHFIIVQEFVKVKWEWRLTKIGDSYFGHQKLLKGYFASGAGLKGWQKPPDELLFLLKDICDRGKFLSMTADVLETEDGRYLVNELIPYVAQKLDHQMLIDGKPGRFIFKDKSFVFEEGEFNQNKSYNLRVKHFVEILESKKGNADNEN